MADPNPRIVAYGCIVLGICRDVSGAVLADVIRRVRVVGLTCARDTILFLYQRLCE